MPTTFTQIVTPIPSKHSDDDKTIKIWKNKEKIEIPIPKNLEVLAFITKDGSIYEIDNSDENVFLVGKENGKSEDLKNILEMNPEHIVSDESKKPEAVIEIKDQIEDDVVKSEALNVEGNTMINKDEV